MDSDDEPLGLVCELGDGVFPLAGSEYRVVGDDSAFARLRWLFFVWIAGDPLERLFGIHEFDGSLVDCLRHKRSSGLR